MERIEKQIVIHSPVQPIFHFISEPFNLMRICPGMIEVSHSLRQKNGGHNFGCEAKMADVRIYFYSTCSEFVVNQCIGYRLSGGLHGTERWLFQPSHEQTQVIYSLEYEVPLPILKGHPRMNLVMRTENDVELLLVNLKKVIETQFLAVRD